MTSVGGWPLDRRGAKSGAAGRGARAGGGTEPAGDDPPPTPAPRVRPTPTPATTITRTTTPNATRTPRRRRGLPPLVRAPGSARGSAAVDAGLRLAPTLGPASSSIRGDANPERSTGTGRNGPVGAEFVLDA